MSKDYLVSIIIPFFNRSNLVLETLDSIKKQSHQNWECILIDDGSNEQDFKVIQNYTNQDARFKLNKRPDNKPKGANACRNVGIELAQGTYLMFFDSDDLMAETCLENRVSYMLKNIQYDFLVFAMGCFTSKLGCYIDEKRKVINLSREEMIIQFFTEKLPWNVCRPFYKTAFIKGKIIFNEKIQNFQDDEFNIRVLSKLKPNFLCLDVTDSFYRVDENNINKYYNPIGMQNSIDSFYEFSLTFFSIIDNKAKEWYRKMILAKLFNTIRFFTCPEIKQESIFRILKLFNKEFKLNLVERIVFLGLIFLNKNWYKKKGSYSIIQRLKTLIS